MKSTSAFSAILSAGLFIVACQSLVSSSSDDRAQPGTLSFDEIEARLAAPGAHVAFVPTEPLGISTRFASVIPLDNPLTPAKVELGRQLYFDKRLSLDQTVSCATCHDPQKGWTDNLPVSSGIKGQKGGRSAPTVINRLLGKSQFWDGRAATLEEQAVGPIGNPIEMGFTTEGAAQRLNSIPGYRVQFERVFGGAASPEFIGKAIAAFERGIVSGANKNDYYEAALPYFDREIEADDEPEFKAKVEKALDGEKAHRMSEAAERGRALYFGKASCSLCHVGEDLTDELFHNLGVGFDQPKPDLGRFDKTGIEADKGAFRTPTLRNIALTAPYMHDGSAKTLMDVVEHYDKGGIANPWLSNKIVPLKLTPEEKQDLVTFMEEALTGSITPVEVPRLP
ncbi:MAG: cytochrome-c peroxidase [Planctomycetes bacterium]|nr:cytochrome-c peroxidase [Planctomycetota bacterium]